MDGGERGRVDAAYRIVADHVRMLTVAISDGLLPSRRESGSVINTLIIIQYFCSAHHNKATGA